MITRLTWQPDDTPGPEALTADIDAALLFEMRQLIGTPEWAKSEAVMWINCQSGPDQTWGKRLFRLARITALEPQEPQ